MRMALLRVVALMAAGCSGSEEDGNAAASNGADALPKGNFTITPPPMPTDPVELRKKQESMVEDMIADPSLPLDMIEGEAYRRGVTLTAEQISRKKAQTPPKTPVVS